MLDFSQVTDYLFIGTTPRSETYPTLRALGIKLVINMRIERPPYRDSHDPPLRALWLPTFDSPFIPIPLRVLERGARAAMQAIEEGGKVYVHCAAGAHRGVAMGASILITQGCSAEEAMELIKKHREAADPDIWYIRRQIVRFSNRWNRVPKEGLAPGE